MLKKTFLSVSVWCAVIFFAQAQNKADSSLKEIILVFKTHFDIGYTDLAEAIVQKYSSTMMENALDVVQKNKNLPKEKQFVWTVSGWPMKQMLSRSNTTLQPQIKKALEEGRFAVHALPVSMETEASDLEKLVRGLNIASTISRDANLPLPRDAKMSDVPSHSWILPTLLTNAGVKILHIGCNPASSSPQVPLLFWWEGPDGSKLMTMYNEKYYGSSLLPPDNWPYKSWLAIMQTNDNQGPPSPEAVNKFIAEAHASAPNAVIRIGRISDFYNSIIKENPQLPIVKGDMPDTWIHGFMSMPKEVKESKKTTNDLRTLETSNTLYNVLTNQNNNIDAILNSAYENSILFDEHTFGMAMSHLESGQWSYGNDFKEQRAEGVYDKLEKSWKEKGNRIFNADITTSVALEQSLKRIANNIQTPNKHIVVYNSLPWKRSGTVNINASSQWNAGNALKDMETGEIIPLNNQKNVLQFVANNVPSMGYKSYTLIKQDNTTDATLKIDSIHQTIENKFYSIQLDAQKGSIVSLIDKRTGKELVNKNSDWGFGQYVYERFSKQDADNYTQSYVKAFHKEWADAELGRPNLTNEPHVTAKAEKATITYEQNNTCVKAILHFLPSANIPHEYNISITLYNNLPYAELNWSIFSKPAESWPEAGWISFPFNIQNASFKLGRLSAIVDPAKDFIKGSNLDYGFINSGLSISNAQHNGIGLSSPDAPGISLEKPGLWKYSKDFTPHQSNVFVNLYNNLWSTNFTEWIEGSWSTKIYVWGNDNDDNEKSIITPSEEIQSPLQGIIAEGNNKGILPLSSSGIQLSEKGILVTAWGKNIDGDGTILRLWEQAGKKSKCVITLPPLNNYKRATLCNLRGEALASSFNLINNSIEVNVLPYQPISILLQ